MSDFDQISLHEELEVRVIALLTGELRESEADELENILTIDPKLSAFRDRMAELMGELHQASDELAAAEGEPPRRLSDERRAKIFGDIRVLEAKPGSKKIWLNPAVWGVAASIAMVFFISALSTVKFVQSVSQSEQVFEAMPVSLSPQKEPEYSVNMQQRNRPTPASPRPAIVVNNPSDLEMPALDIDVNVDSSSAYGRGIGGFGGGLSGLREMSVSDGRIDGSDRDYAKAGQVIPVEIPDELIEGTPQPIRVPNLERRATDAPRMLVRPSSEIAESEKMGDRGEGGSFAIDSDTVQSDFGYLANAKQEAESRYKAKDNVASLGRDKESNWRFSGVAGASSSAPADPFAAPTSGSGSVSSRAEADESEYRSNAYYANVPVDAFAETKRKKLREDTSGVADRDGREMDEITVLNANIASGDGIVLGGSVAGNYSGMDLFAAPSTSKPKGQVSTERQSEVAQLSKQGRAHYFNGDYDAAKDDFEDLNGIDSGNKEAKFFSKRIDSTQPSDSLASVATVSLTPKPEKLAAEEPFSTFSLNISDVSFKLAQAALQNSRVPPKAQIRTEEFVNSFDYGDPSPRVDEPVALNWEIAQHPFEHDRQVVRFSLQTQASGRASGQPLNISLLVDNSGSMQRPDRQAILQNSLQTLEEKLTPQDNLNIILFARQPRLIAEAQTRESQKAAVASALAYRPEGGTNLEAGLKAAYETADRNFLPNGSNRVIVMTDGAANLGNVNAGELAELVVEQRKQGIALDAYGIGWDDYNDALLEEITRNGDGRYAFLNSVEEASADFAEKLAGTLRVAASNVKVQIEWNPDRVKRYRQIGYDLHQLKKEDFRDNTVDAAEIGEAESGTALYVMKIDDDPKIIGGLGTLHVRYLDPASGLYKEHSWPLPMPRQIPAANAASPSMRLAMSSAFFGERLADSPYAGGYGFNDLYTMMSGLPEAFPKQPRVTQMQSMLLQESSG